MVVILGGTEGGGGGYPEVRAARVYRGRCWLFCRGVGGCSPGGACG